MASETDIRVTKGGFSLVEVTLALGVVAFALLSLLGLFAVGVNSTRDSSLDTSYAQIALHINSNYPGGRTATSGSVSYQETYTFDGTPTTGTASDVFFTVKVVGALSSTGVIASTSTNLHLITYSISNPQTPGVNKVFQTSAYIP